MSAGSDWFAPVKELHARVIQDVFGSFIVGSYLINPETAKDIDIVVPFSAYAVYTAHAKDNLFGEFDITNRDDPEYDRSDISCLVQTMRSRDKKVNILLIADEYIAAYKAAVEHAKNYPDEQQTREQRVEIYNMFEERVRSMLQGTY